MSDIDSRVYGVHDKTSPADTVLNYDPFGHGGKYKEHSLAPSPDKISKQTEELVRNEMLPYTVIDDTVRNAPHKLPELDAASKEALAKVKPGEGWSGAPPSYEFVDPIKYNPNPLEFKPTSDNSKEKTDINAIGKDVAGDGKLSAETQKELATALADGSLSKVVESVNQDLRDQGSSYRLSAVEYSQDVQYNENRGTKSLHPGSIEQPNKRATLAVVDVNSGKTEDSQIVKHDPFVRGYEMVK